MINSFIFSILRIPIGTIAALPTRAHAGVLLKRPICRHLHELIVFKLLRFLRLVIALLIFDQISLITLRMNLGTLGIDYSACESWHSKEIT